MKETEIKIRIDNELKTKFKNKCYTEKTSMSNKIIKIINEDVNFLNDGIYFEQEKPIRVNLVKMVLYNTLNEFMFEFCDDLKPSLEKKFKENLNFKVIVSEIKNNEIEKFHYGNVYFYLENNTPICIDYTVCSNGN
jgi:hypothetical protein